MGKLLFSPNGKLSPADFMRGAIFLALLLFFIKAANFVSVMLGGLLALIGLVLIYCWFVIYIKRLRYTGNSAWLSLVPIFFMVLIGLVAIEPMVQRIFAPDLVLEAQTAMLEAMEAGGFGAILGVSEEYAQPIGTATGLPVAIARGLWALLVAFVTNKLLLKR